MTNTNIQLRVASNERYGELLLQEESSKNTEAVIAGKQKKHSALAKKCAESTKKIKQNKRRPKLKVSLGSSGSSGDNDMKATKVGKKKTASLTGGNESRARGKEAGSHGRGGSGDIVLMEGGKTRKTGGNESSAKRKGKGSTKTAVGRKKKANRRTQRENAAAKQRMLEDMKGDHDNENMENRKKAKHAHP